MRISSTLKLYGLAVLFVVLSIIVLTTRPSIRAVDAQATPIEQNIVTPDTVNQTLSPATADGHYEWVRERPVINDVVVLSQNNKLIRNANKTKKFYPLE